MTTSHTTRIGSLVGAVLVLALLALLTASALRASDGPAAPPDPYAAQYAAVHDNLRFPVLRARHDEMLTLDNVRDGLSSGKTYIPRWANASVDLSKLLSAKMLVLTFPIGPLPLGGHAEILFQFAPGGFRGADGTDLQGLIFSFEAYRAKDEPYRPFTSGIHDGYSSVWVVETRRCAWGRIPQNNSHVQVADLDLDATELRRLFEAYLARTLDRVYLESTPYHTFTNSCVTNQFDVLRSSLPPRNDKPAGHVWRPSRVIARLAGMGLVRRAFGLDVPGQFGAWVRHGTVPELVAQGLTWDDLHGQ